jgi:hypothetical protein
MGQSDQDQNQKHGGLKADLSVVKQKQKPLFCRSRLAGEEPENAAFIQDANVIVNDHRRQASSYSGSCPL